MTIHRPRPESIAKRAPARPDRRLNTLLATLAAAVFASFAIAQPQPGGSAQEQRDPGGAEIKTAEDLLVALEKADQDIRTLSAQIQYDKVAGDIEGNDRQTRTGTLHFADTRAGATPSEQGGRSFFIRFDKLLVDNNVRDEAQVFVLHGEWFIEKLENQKQMFRQRIAAPGERVDPLRLGEGSFPVPIGQRREDILARFEVELLPGPDGLPPHLSKDVRRKAVARYADAYQLRLVPRPGTQEARDYREIRVRYSRDRLLPLMASAVRTDGGSDEVALLKVRINEALPDGIFDLEAPPGWQVQERPFRKAIDDGDR